MDIIFKDGEEILILGEKLLVDPSVPEDLKQLIKMEMKCHQELLEAFGNNRRPVE